MIPQPILGQQTNHTTSHKEEKARLDKWLIIIPIILSLCGLIMLASITPDLASSQQQHPFYYVFKQLSFFVASCLIVVTIFMVMPMHLWFQINAILFIGSVLLLGLILVPGIGVEVNGSTRWLNLKFLRFQPSELLKVSMLIYLASYLSKQTQWMKYHRLPIEPLIVFSIPACLLIVQPDFTPIIILFTLMLSLLLAGGLAWRWLIIFLLTGLTTLLSLIYYTPYRLRRFDAVLDPWSKQSDEGYQITQALLAIGRGGWFGKDMGNSIQKSFYLPEAHTDFLFVILVEELGVIAGFIIILLFIFLISRVIMVAIRAKRCCMMFTHYLIFGIAILLALQTLVNLGVNLGLLPTTGVPLPFLSYGGSHLLVTAILTGICLRADAETKKLV